MTMMGNFNEIGIDSELDWDRITHLFLMPVSGVFLVFFLIAAITQIAAFARGLTPYPKWCWVFSMLSGIVIIVIMRFAGNHPLAYAISTAWISIGSFGHSAGCWL